MSLWLTAAMPTVGAMNSFSSLTVMDRGKSLNSWLRESRVLTVSEMGMVEICNKDKALVVVSKWWTLSLNNSSLLRARPVTRFFSTSADFFFNLLRRRSRTCCCWSCRVQLWPEKSDEKLPKRSKRSPKLGLSNFLLLQQLKEHNHSKLKCSKCTKGFSSPI